MKKYLPNLLTFCNIISGLGSIALSLNHQFNSAAIFMIIAMIIDKLDGCAARKLSAESPLGKNLDSLSDLVSFGVAPFVFVLSQHRGPLLFLSGMIFVCAGAYRLARFMTRDQPYFSGIPITLNGILFPLLFFLHWNTASIFTIAFIGMGILMISTIKVPKI